MVRVGTVINDGYYGSTYIVLKVISPGELYLVFATQSHPVVGYYVHFIKVHQKQLDTFPEIYKVIAS